MSTDMMMTINRTIDPTMPSLSEDFLTAIEHLLPLRSMMKQ